MTEEQNPLSGLAPVDETTRWVLIECTQTDDEKGPIDSITVYNVDGTGKKLRPHEVVGLIREADAMIHASLFPTSRQMTDEQYRDLVDRVMEVRKKGQAAREAEAQSEATEKMVEEAVTE